MNDEIKEIEEWLRDISTPTGLSYSGDRTLSNSMVDHIIDYITNLQQENERLKNGYCELKVKCNNGECDCTNEEYEGMAQANMKLSLEIDDYKSRCEKAIEYINNFPDISYASIEKVDGKRLTGRLINKDDLLNILQNGSDEE